MVCTKHNNTKMKVFDIVHTKENETIRMYKCPICNVPRYTIEKEVQNDELLWMKWSENYRKHKK